MDAIEYTRKNCAALDAALIAKGCRPIFAPFDKNAVKAEEKNEETIN